MHLIHSSFFNFLSSRDPFSAVLLQDGRRGVLPGGGPPGGAVGARRGRVRFRARPLGAGRARLQLAKVPQTEIRLQVHAGVRENSRFRALDALLGEFVFFYFFAASF